MDARIKDLGERLLAITDNPPERPTSDDRNTLVGIRNEIKKLAEEDMGEQDTTDRQGLYVLATQEANRQERFYEDNGNKWADAA